MTSESDSEWFLKEKAGTTGPLSESDMREHVERSTNDELLIRQGNSAWRSVDIIRKKIRQLQKNGIFIRYKNVAEGPFTLTRAHHVLKLMTPGGIDVRTGANGPWIPAKKWLSKIDKLLKVESKELDSLSVAVQHVLGRKGFVGPTQNSDELDLAEADKEGVPVPAKTETPTEQPLWLSPEPISNAEPIVEAQPIVEAEVIKEPVPVYTGNNHRQTEPVIEVVKVMHTAEIADRADRIKTAGTVPPASSKALHTARGSTVASESSAHNKPPARPPETINRARPRNNTSQKNRTRTNQEKSVIAGLAVAIACVLSFTGWKWLAETDSTVAQTQTTGELQTKRDASAAGKNGQAKTEKQPTDAPQLMGNDPLAETTNQGPTKQISDKQPAADTTTASDTTASDTENSASVPRDKSQHPPLTISMGTLFRPRFGTSEGEVYAGTAFAAKLPGKSQTLILTALHLFGPAGGLKTEIEADKLAKAWNKLIVEDCKTDNYFGEIRMQPLNLSGARPHPQKSELGDIAACTVTDPTAIEALPLSPRIPSNGERVWLVSKLRGSRGLMHPATVERRENGWLLYSFTDRNIDIQSTSGAPIVDQKGKVVAVSTSSTQKDGKTIGCGTPVLNFYPTLATLVN